MDSADFANEEVEKKNKIFSDWAYNWKDRDNTGN